MHKLSWQLGNVVLGGPDQGSYHQGAEHQHGESSMQAKLVQLLGSTSRSLL